MIPLYDVIRKKLMEYEGIPINKNLRKENPKSNKEKCMKNRKTR